MIKLEAKISHNNTFGIIEKNLDIVSILILANIVRNNFIHSESYKVRQKASAFLQGIDIKNGYIFIEFWNDNYGDEFIEYANKMINNGDERRTIECLILDTWDFGLGSDNNEEIYNIFSKERKLNHEKN